MLPNNNNNCAFIVVVVVSVISAAAEEEEIYVDHFIEMWLAVFARADENNFSMRKSWATGA